ncbi:MAG: class I SAM-dependent methyltransferase [Proteobacteria bacterium]|nr:MAG: class I SAM-dependent methyltransferase [Pseudomonadota bacterium]QKK10948.1 MAG: class I SAM-dependent methyltransferase [Pseudomonadota bacterium]
MIERIPEPELMGEEAQARAYSEADFAEPHDNFVAQFLERFPRLPVGAQVLDMGCGPADITCRFARAIPECRIDGVDGAAAMLRFGEQRVQDSGLGGRIRLIEGYLPGATLPRERYEVLISNSLLHHLPDPQTLWSTVNRHAAAGAIVFIMDLMRPASRERAQALVDHYTAGEPEVLRRDFYHSLLAAFTPAEVQTQLTAASLGQLELEVINDRHLIVSGRI